MALTDGRKTVAVAGTAEALAAASGERWLIITAETDNTGIIVVGGSTVVAALATRRGTPLTAGASAAFSRADVGNNALDLADFFLDTTVNGDGVTFSAEVVD